MNKEWTDYKAEYNCELDRSLLQDIALLTTS